MAFASLHENIASQEVLFGICAFSAPLIGRQGTRFQQLWAYREACLSCHHRPCRSKKSCRESPLTSFPKKSSKVCVTRKLQNPARRHNLLTSCAITSCGHAAPLLIVFILVKKIPNRHKGTNIQKEPSCFSPHCDYLIGQWARVLPGDAASNNHLLPEAICARRNASKTRPN